MEKAKVCQLIRSAANVLPYVRAVSERTAFVADVAAVRAKKALARLHMCACRWPTPAQSEDLGERGLHQVRGTGSGGGQTRAH